MRLSINNEEVKLPRLVEVIVSQINKGDGKNTPIRPVTQVHDCEGNFIAERDACLPAPRLRNDAPGALNYSSDSTSVEKLKRELKAEQSAYRIASRENNRLVEENKTLRAHHDFSIGLHCIDRNPREVTHEWIRENAFQLEAAKGIK